MRKGTGSWGKRCRYMRSTMSVGDSVELVATLASHIMAEEGVRSTELRVSGLVRIKLEKSVTSFIVFIQCKETRIHMSSTCPNRLCEVRDFR